MISREAQLTRPTPCWLSCSLLTLILLGGDRYMLLIPNTPTGKGRREGWTTCQGLLNKAGAVPAKVSSSNWAQWETQPFRLAQLNRQTSGCGQNEIKFQRKTNIWYHLSVESKNMIQMNLFTKQTHRHKKQTYGYTKVERGEREIRSLGLTYTHY